MKEIHKKNKIKNSHIHKGFRTRDICGRKRVLGQKRDEIFVVLTELNCEKVHETDDTPLNKIKMSLK